MQQIPILLLDAQKSLIIEANEAARDLLGYAHSGTLAGKTVESVLADLASAQADDKGARWVRFPDGKRHWLWPIATALPNDAGHTLLILKEADQAVLEARAFQGFATALSDLDDGVPISSVLSALCDRLVQSLDLSLARVVSFADAERREAAFSGGEAIAEAVRGSGDSANPATPVASAAAEAFRTGMPVYTRIETQDGDRNVQCRKHGIRCAVAWPLKDLEVPLVIELFAAGADDLSDPPTSTFLNQWMPWLNEQFAKRALSRQKQLIADALTHAVTPAFITDSGGVIIWVNHGFSSQYGYTPKEAIGKTPRILQSGHHGQRYYEGLWSAILGGHAWSGRTIDRAADGRLFTVRQSVSPVRQAGGLPHFLAIHSDITDEAELASFGELQRGTDELTGLMTCAAFEERCREILATAEFEGHKPAFMLISVRTRSGEIPVLGSEAAAFVYGEIGERIRSVLPDGGIAGNLTSLDFAVLLPPSPTVPEELARNLVEIIPAPIPLLGNTLELDCRSAIVTFPKDGRTIDDLRKAADRQLAAINL